ncbi:hypothetical protein [Gracilinema caldarium]|uniref:Uncharacterized protein n=1 Tax=Gracilinema caldarium (strain ATCC 51460 / DSM 7334 / H1) TaxID=744872 RepID=F8F1J5_GRAC1|nr:hypothetical protein [Gracilinema caldarium]AEJ19048.1 hypothetical protein Spica_0894 [Gracilinema caldarium DSM 7334]
MNKVTFYLVSFVLVIGLIPTISAQSLKGMSLNGSTGLISIPNGRIGWEKSADIGVDLGYHGIFEDSEIAHIGAASVSLFKRVELSFAYDNQIGDDNGDTLIGGKIQLPTSGTAVAVGTNFQMLQQGGSSSNATQIYLAATYPSTFFNMPAETTVVVGKTFIKDSNDSNIDFGMGFDLLLFPKVFQNYIHWITDFSNFSYSVQAVGSNAYQRGSLNTGIRIDLAASPSLRKYKFVIDAMLTDALDTNRAFTLGFAAGIPIQ